MAWNLLLGVNSDPEVPTAMLRSCFWDESQLEVYRFSELQRDYLGLSGKLYSKVLEATPRSDINQEDANGMTILSWAASRRDHRVVEKLIMCGADSERADRIGFNSLHHALSGRDAICVRLLLDTNLSVEARDSRGMTPLMIAAQTDNDACLKLLLSTGADIHARGIEGYTVLHCAA